MPLNANAIVDVAGCKSMIKLLGSADDTIVENLINGTSLMFESYCASKFINQNITEVADGSGSNKLIVENCPITAITEVKFDFDTIAPVVMALSGFNFNGKAGIINNLTGLFTEGFQNIQVKYTSGYGAAKVNLPDDLKLATYLQIEYIYKRDNADFSATLKDGVIFSDPKKFLSYDIMQMLTPYMKVRF